MRLASMAILGALLAAPAMAGDLGAENMFGRDPGNDVAYACFSKTFDEAWLKAHPDQNVTKMTVFVARRSGEAATVPSSLAAIPAHAALLNALHHP